MPYHENYRDFFKLRQEIELSGVTYDLEDVYEYFKQRMLDEIKVDSSDIFQRITLKDATM
jgi:hypothetical protein